jgi:hypothetical protein
MFSYPKASSLRLIRRDSGMKSEYGVNNLKRKMAEDLKRVMKDQSPLR